MTLNPRLLCRIVKHCRQKTLFCPARWSKSCHHSRSQPRSPPKLLKTIYFLNSLFSLYKDKDKDTIIFVLRNLSPNSFLKIRTFYLEREKEKIFESNQFQKKKMEKFF